MRTARIRCLFLLFSLACLTGSVCAQTTVYYKFTFQERGPNPPAQWPRTQFVVSLDHYLTAGEEVTVPGVAIYGETFTRFGYSRDRTNNPGTDGYYLKPANDDTAYGNGVVVGIHAKMAVQTGPGTWYLNSWQSTSLWVNAGAGYTTYWGTGDTVVIQNTPPVLVRMAGMSADARGREVNICWQTASEVGTAGFRVLRSEDGEAYEVITPDVVPAQGGPTVPARYVWTDSNVTPGRAYEYLIEEVEDSGATNRFGPVGVVIPTSRRSR